MSPNTAVVGESFDLAYLVLSGSTTAARCPELLRVLLGLGFSTVIAIPTPNASRVIAPRDLADIEGVPGGRQTTRRVHLTRHGASA